MTGELWAADVGASIWEEVNLVKKGGNYGWRIMAGNHCRRRECDRRGLLTPVIAYDHTEGIAVIGGYVYRGRAIPELVGSYVFGDIISPDIWGIAYDQNGHPQRRIVATSPRNGPHSFAEGNDGELYILREGPGRQTLKKLVPKLSAPPVVSAFPTRLSETGCVASDNPLQPATGLISYRVNSILWSDGAVKQRWMALPEGIHIQVNADGDFVFPAGTVLMKSFFIDQTPIETRLFVRHDDDGWAGYSYEWLDDQSDALLLPAGKTKVLPNGQTWTYPHRAQCLQCHTAAAGFSLGPELPQLNGVHLYTATGRRANQLRTLEHIGVFDEPLPAEPAQLPALAAVADTSQAVAHRARSYLHTNCSGCHRPAGPTPAAIDFRFSTAFARMRVCDVAPQHSDLGIADAALLKTGVPERSMVWHRMQRRDLFQMPPLATRLVDTVAVDTIASWILSQNTCE